MLLFLRPGLLLSIRSGLSLAVLLARAQRPLEAAVSLGTFLTSCRFSQERQSFKLPAIFLFPSPSHPNALRCIRIELSCIPSWKVHFVLKWSIMCAEHGQLLRGGRGPAPSRAHVTQWPWCSSLHPVPFVTLLSCSSNRSDSLL